MRRIAITNRPTTHRSNDRPSIVASMRPQNPKPTRASFDQNCQCCRCHVGGQMNAAPTVGRRRRRSLSLYDRTFDLTPQQDITHGWRCGGLAQVHVGCACAKFNCLIPESLVVLGALKVVYILNVLHILERLRRLVHLVFSKSRMTLDNSYSWACHTCRTSKCL